MTVAAGSLLAGGLGALGIGLGAALGFTAHAGAVLLALRARGLWRPDARLFARLIRGAAASLAHGGGSLRGHGRPCRTSAAGRCACPSSPGSALAALPSTPPRRSRCAP